MAQNQDIYLQEPTKNDILDIHFVNLLSQIKTLQVT